ncbi:hypothetical protein Q7P37_007781 [Cladosporium fusiforme]
MDDDGGAIVGHSNDSLLASADEMAGDYSPHTPATNTTAVQPTSARHSSTTHNGTSANETSVEVTSTDDSYSMPPEPVIWTQAVHPDSIQRLMSMENEATLETFGEASKIYSHVNPENFMMPLDAKVVCMKLDKPQDMRYAIKVGHVTNLPSCNKRLNEIYNSRGEQKVFMLFSISGNKEFCAMGEVNSPVKIGSMPGWSKAGCEGIIDVTFIFIKDVPFKLVNHIKHKGNGQPVANMWNSMLYHDNTGYHVAKVYVEHPVLSSILINFRSEMDKPYKSQLRIQSSGNTAYSASSFGSKNEKNYDPRSATRVLSNRGNRGQWSGTDRRAIQTQSWRQNGLSQFVKSTELNADNSATPVAPARLGIFSSTPISRLPSPPRFQLANQPREPIPKSAQSSSSFTTPDERLLANFTGFQEEAKKRMQQRDTEVSASHSSQSGFGASRGGLPIRQPPVLSINTDWRKPNGNGNGNGSTLAAYQNNAHGGQFQQTGRVPPLSVFTNQSTPGMGVTYNNGRAYTAQSRPPMQFPVQPAQLPSPANSSATMANRFFPQVHSVPQHPTSGFATPKAKMFQNKGLGSFGDSDLTRSLPLSARGFKRDQAGVSFQCQDNTDDSVKRGIPIKHSQSMPVMIPPDTVASSAQRLRGQAIEFSPSNTNNRFASSPVVEDWVVTTPTRATTSEQSPSKSLALVPSSDAKFDEGRITRLLSAPEQHKYHLAQVMVLEVQLATLRKELEVDPRGQRKNEERATLLAEIESQYKYHLARKDILEVRMKTAEKEHEEARGDLAQESVDAAPISPSEPMNSSEFSRPSEGFEETIIAPEQDEAGNFIRSVSKDGDGKPAHTSQVTRHRRGGIFDPNTGGFTGSFDARLVANVEGVLASPSRENTHPVGSHQPFTDARFLGGESISARTPQYGSSNDDKYLDNNSSFNNDSANDVESQISFTDEDDVFSPRGRFFFPAQRTRDASQVSYAGGIGLHERYEYK